MNFWQWLAINWEVVLSVGLTIASFIYAIIKAKKSGNTKGILQLYALIPEFVAEAESTFGRGNGQAKLNFVLTKLRVYALEHAIKVDCSELTNQIESVVSTTNLVNIDKSTPITTDQHNENVVGNVVETSEIDNKVNINI